MSRPTQPPVEPDRDGLQLGIFMPNCSHTYHISRYKPEPDDWTYAANERIALAAEAAGFDFLFPVSRWRGFGGETDYMGRSLETMTWAAALLAATRTVRVYSTVHVPVFHPLVAAKMGATLDHIGNGRWGINIVSGWNAHDFAMMGVELLPHAERYARTADFIAILKGLWTEEPGTFDYDSKWYRIRGGYVMPQPVQRPHPPIVNAGSSDDARDVVARLCDWIFLSPPSIEATRGMTVDIRTRAAGYGRRVRSASCPFVLWRDTEREAEAEKRRIIDEADDVALANWARGLGLESGSFDDFTKEMFVIGGGALPIVGTPEQVAEKLVQLYRSGVDAVLMIFLSFHDDTVRFGQDIVPLLRQLDVVE